jgi:hypothetical protein
MNNEKLLFILELIASQKLPSELVDSEKNNHDWEVKCASIISLARDVLKISSQVKELKEDFKPRKFEIFR